MEIIRIITPIPTVHPIVRINIQVDMRSSLRRARLASLEPFSIFAMLMILSGLILVPIEARGSLG
ncbi:hypothetical protein EB834_20245 [Brevibacterium aurantiacum]|uniref:Uncharacterized protein n=1 Tax=Brevibacterium aurantiacum TaxID=273384 RepID=A0A2A3YVD7_BREAU|nr:hypothetical protein CIK65_08750 [Brevibacterium aurantiacum]TGD36298.1 hypothetical protein EB834_20245 [Brevibacterium aurantiacum]